MAMGFSEQKVWGSQDSAAARLTLVA